MQTYFNIIYLPTFTINLVSIFAAKPMLKTLGDYWNNNEKKKFSNIIIKIIILLFLATLIIELVCATVAIPILTIVFGVNLSMYKIELLILVASGFLYAVSTVEFYALSTIRKQKSTTFCYIITAILAFFISKVFVKNYGMIGASLSNLIIDLLLLIMLTILLIKSIKKKMVD